MKKVIIVGSGLVGSSAAFDIISRQLVDELVMIDAVQERAEGEAMDLIDSCAGYSKKMVIKAGGYEECRNADIVVLTAGLPRKPGQSRLDLVEANKAIIGDIVPKVMKNGFNGIFIVVSNPVDVMAYYTYKLSGLHRSKIIGTGTALDTIRLRNVIAERFGIFKKDVEAYVVGEHGDSQSIPWSLVKINGESLADYCKNNNIEFTDEDKAKICAATKIRGAEIIARKKATYYGIAGIVTNIVKVILNDEVRVTTAACCLEGEYGIEGTFGGSLVYLTKDGIGKIVKMDMTEAELAAFRASCENVKQFCN